MDSSSQSYGTGLNNAGGGVFVTEISQSTIKIWRFDRNSVPGDVYGANPNPSGWGSPQAVFSGACDIDRNFNSLNIIFDTTFCKCHISTTLVVLLIWDLRRRLGWRCLGRLILCKSRWYLQRLRRQQPCGLPRLVLEHQLLEGVQVWR